jgi:molybdopterin synthase catalytic subunit
MHVKVQAADFDPGQEIAEIRRRFTDIGAILSFVGLVRDFSDGSQVCAMTLEHYPGMTEMALQSIMEEAREKWNVLDATIIHRVGTLEVSDQIVLVLVASSHRQDAFRAAEYMIDQQKTKAPFWKKETTPEGSRWVDAKESDDVKASRWVE